MKNLLAAFLIHLLTFASHPIAQAQTDVLLPRFEIPNTQVLKFSSSLGQEYNLYVNLPHHYGQDPGKAYPVLYVLDGQWDFALLNGIYGGQYYDGFLPELITIGISWSGKDPDYSSLRERDFTPTPVADKPGTGGAPKFLNFLKKELIPFIGSRYHVTEDRTLMGTSLGGLFTLYALFEDPSLFRRYVVTSPSLWWDNKVLNTFEKKYEENRSAAPVRLFMAIGDLETDVSDFNQFAERLKRQNIKSLELQTRIIENGGHSGSAAEGFARGLQSVFNRPSLQLATALLDRYSGTYQFESVLVSLAKENGKLVAVTPENKYVLQAEGEKDFYVKGALMNVHFKTDDAGKVTGFQLDQFEGGIFMKKIK